MKILHIIPTLAKGGAERLTIDICKELTLQGNEVKLLVLYPVCDYDFMLEGVDVTFLNINFQYAINGKHRGSVVPVLDFITTFKPNIIHSHLFESEIILSQIDYLDAKYIVHFHDNMPQFSKWNGKFSKKEIIHYLVRKQVVKSYKNKDVSFIAISNDTLNFIHKNLPKQIKVHLLLNAINRERFLPTDLTIQRKPLSIVMIGSLVDKKNQQLAIRVIDALHKKGYPFSLDLLGEGPNRKQLETLVKQLDLVDFITLHGNVDFPEDFLKTREFYLHTASYEPFGLVLVEAMTAMIPVISLDGFGNRDLIQHEVNGLIEKKHSELALAEHIIRLLKEEQFRLELMQRAFEFSKAFSIVNYTSKLVEKYRF